MKKAFFVLFINVYPAVELTTLSPDRWLEYKELRLRSLSEEPEAFAVPVEDEQDLPENYWVNALKSNLFVFAEDNGKLVGMVGACKEYESVTYCRHLVTLTQVYVVPEARKQGIGFSLVKAMLDNLSSKNEPTVVMMWVTINKAAPVALYKKLGFTVCGTLSNSVWSGTKFYDSYLMQKEINI